MFVRVMPIAILSIALCGCEKTNHDSIDKWTHTEKGPDKLRRALSDEAIDPDLSAHAAANLLRKMMDHDVMAAFDTMSPGRRTQVVDKLAPRLWEVARVNGEELLPTPPQAAAKDMLVNIRRFASDPVKKEIDGYLTDYYCVRSYEARAAQGSGPTLGAAVIHMLGPAAGKRLISVANAVLAAPGQDTNKNTIGPELLLGLAESGNPDAVKYVLDIAQMDRGDKQQPLRAMRALDKAFVEPDNQYEAADPAALVPNLGELVEVAKNDKLPAEAANHALDLIRLVGPPKCVEALVSMIGYPHPNPIYRYSIPNNALRCGGPTAIREVVRAIPDLDYPKDNVKGSFADDIARMTPRAAVQDQLRGLLTDKSKMSRWIAIEALAEMKSVEDAPKIMALAGSHDRLTGYWGSDKSKPDPTLGERAKELAGKLSGSK
jgi:hypothetical protein